MSLRGRLCALAALVALAIAPPAIGQASPISVLLEPRVPADAVADFTRAGDLTIQFYRETYGLELTRSIRVVLTADAAAYAAAMIREWNISQAEADRRVRTTSGWASSTTIVVNVGNLATPRARLFLASHELTHQYQIQLSAPTGAWTLYWLAEGVADVIGARVVERGGAGSLADTRQAWLNVLRRAATRPDLNQIVTEPTWFAALTVHGAGVTYRYAGIAALYLAETRGYPTLMAYFAALRDTRGPGPAFQRAVGVTLDEFTAEYRAYIDRLLQ